MVYNSHYLNCFSELIAGRAFVAPLDLPTGLSLSYEKQNCLPTAQGKTQQGQEDALCLPQQSSLEPNYHILQPGEGKSKLCVWAWGLLSDHGKTAEAKGSRVPWNKTNCRNSNPG